MSSVSVFQPYVDKENTGVRHKQRDGSVTGLGGKVFQSQRPIQSTPRSALRDVNKDLSAPAQNKSQNKPQKHMVAPSQQLFKKPGLQPLEASQKNTNKIYVDPVKKQKVAIETKQRVIVKNPEPLPEIEHLHIYNENEEIKPKRDLDFTGVVDRLRKWRPPCLFGSRPDSDDEEDDGKGDVESDVFNLPESDMVAPDLGDSDPFGEDELIQLSDIHIPDVDIDLPIPFLDDSLDIEPNMGTLEIYDASTPKSLSPNEKNSSL